MAVPWLHHSIAAENQTALERDPAWAPVSAAAALAGVTEQASPTAATTLASTIIHVNKIEYEYEVTFIYDSKI